MKTKEQKMRTISLDSVTLHCSTADPAKLTKAEKLLELVAKAKPVRTLAKKRIPSWKIRPGMPLGCKVTIRGKRAMELLRTLLSGIASVSQHQIGPGFLSFGIKEYIQLPNIAFQRDIGIMGFDVVVRLKRPGWRVERRRRARAKVGAPHRINSIETAQWFKSHFNLKIENDS